MRIIIYIVRFETKFILLNKGFHKTRVSFICSESFFSKKPCRFVFDEGLLEYVLDIFC